MRYPKYIFPLCRDSAKLFQRCEDIVLSLDSLTLVVSDTAMIWHTPFSSALHTRELLLVELFGV